MPRSMWRAKKAKELRWKLLFKERRIDRSVRAGEESQVRTLLFFRKKMRTSCWEFKIYLIYYKVHMPKDEAEQVMKNHW